MRSVVMEVFQLPLTYKSTPWEYIKTQTYPLTQGHNSYDVYYIGLDMTCDLVTCRKERVYIKKT